MIALRPIRRIKRVATALQRYKRSRGFGIHSPFAFHFILRVLREKAPYYCYPQLVTKRRSAAGLLAGEDSRANVMSVKCMKMLLRLAAWFRPDTVLVLGDDCGLGVISLLSASSKTTAVTAGMGREAGVMLRPLASRVRPVSDVAAAVAAYGVMTESSFMLVNGESCSDMEAACSAAVAATEAGGIVVFRSLDTSAEAMRQWNRILGIMKWGMTFSNGKTGIIVARKHLPRQDFSLWF